MWKVCTRPARTAVRSSVCEGLLETLTEDVVSPNVCGGYSRILGLGLIFSRNPDAPALAKPPFCPLWGFSSTPKTIKTLFSVLVPPASPRTEPLRQVGNVPSPQTGLCWPGGTPVPENADGREDSGLGEKADLVPSRRRRLPLTCRQSSALPPLEAHLKHCDLERRTSVGRPDGRRHGASM